MLDNTQEIVSLLERVLGDASTVSKTDVSFYCPFCTHHKKKLQVHIQLQHWRCWVCNTSGKSLYTLLSKAKAPKEIRKELTKILSNGVYVEAADDTKETVILPYEYEPLWVPNMASPHYRNAVHYMLNRGITPEEIVRYRIGYCTEGPYSGKIIIPSYDSRGRLNFFVSRAFYKDDKHKHKNPKISKDIIGFESFINWSLPIVLVEGAFDAIAVRRNAIPLFGKTVPDALRFKILEEDVNEIYICLDLDARADALEFAEEFMAMGKNVYFVDLHQKDPSEIGFEGMVKYIRDAKIMDRSDLFSKQILEMFNS